MEKPEFKTDNIDLTAFLLEAGFTPIGSLINGWRRVSFLFQDNKELRKALIDYETGAVTSAKSLLEQRAKCYRIVSDILRRGIASFSQQSIKLTDMIMMIGISSIARWL